MATIVEALDRIARQCSVRKPSSWVTATRTDQVELRDDFFLETVEDILSRVDLPSPLGQQTTLTGGSGAAQSNGAERFTLPADFARIQRDKLAVYDVDQDQPCIPVVNDGEWTYLTDIGATGAIKYYRLQGYEGNWTLDVYDAPGTGSEIVVSYASTNWMASDSGTVGKVFSSETDVLLLPRRVVEVGTVWRFRERRGLPYEDKFGEYEALISRLSNDRRGRRTVNFGEPDRSIKWQDMVPAFIPDS